MISLFRIGSFSTPFDAQLPPRRIGQNDFALALAARLSPARRRLEGGIREPVSFQSSARLGAVGGGVARQCAILASIWGM
jgi:hypothetical protein